MSDSGNGRASTFVPTIAPAIWQLRPDFAALSIVAEGCINAENSPWASERLAEAAAACRAGPDWAAGHLAAWQEAFRGFGAKPQRTPSSAEALRKRVERGGLPSVNAVVDLYNAVSVAFAVPVGGEDIDRYAGVPHLTRATGEESFETTKDGQPVVEHPEPGEVIWRDEHGVTCRRWNWRQGPRTRIETGSRNLWFVLERLEPMPIEALLRAGEGLCRDLVHLSPGVRIAQRLHRRDGVSSPATGSTE